MCKVLINSVKGIKHPKLSQFATSRKHLRGLVTKHADRSSDGFQRKHASLW